MSGREELSLILCVSALCDLEKRCGKGYFYPFLKF